MTCMPHGKKCFQIEFFACIRNAHHLYIRHAPQVRRECLAARRLYRADYNDRLQALRAQPVHNWTSHGADPFRYLAMTLDRKVVLSDCRRKIAYLPQGVA